MTPFLESFVTQRRRQRLAVWLYDAVSLNKLSQSVLEMLRAGIQDLASMSLSFTPPMPIWTTRSCSRCRSRSRIFERLDPARQGVRAGARRTRIRLCRPVRVLRHVPRRGSRQRHIAADERADRRGVGKPPLVAERHRSVLSSSLQPQGASGILQLHRQPPAERGVPHLFGRYISDTLSGVRAVRAEFLTTLPVAPDDKLANQYLLCALLSEKADVLETPVQFLPLSPGRVRRTTLAEGLRSLAVIGWQRMTRTKRGVATAAAAADLKPRRRGAGLEALAIKEVTLRAHA
jgi:hypothetical protein